MKVFLRLCQNPDIMGQIGVRFDFSDPKIIQKTKLDSQIRKHYFLYRLNLGFLRLCQNSNVVGLKGYWNQIQRKHGYIFYCCVD